MPSITQEEGKTLITVTTIPRLEKRPDYELLSDNRLRRGLYEIQLVPVVLDSEYHIGIIKLLKRAREHDAQTSERLYRLLWRCRSRLPVAWGAHDLVFAGTIWKGGFWEDGPQVLRAHYDHRGLIANYVMSTGAFNGKTRLVKLVPKEA